MDNENADIVRDAITRCRQVMEDGWDEENYRYIETNIRKILYGLQEKVKVPSGNDIDKTLSVIKERFGPGQVALESCIGYLYHMEKEWVSGRREPFMKPDNSKKWEDLFEG
ncbi:MAG: hypothetical protein PHW14_00165 [Candidatus Omnitrophica bacterium]|jgi:hypothetical protein|nr:hypothetical protein [Candidatus Omnitrophota bacterium]